MNELKILLLVVLIFMCACAINLVIESVTIVRLLSKTHDGSDNND